MKYFRKGSALHVIAELTKLPEFEDGLIVPKCPIIRRSNREETLTIRVGDSLVPVNSNAYTKTGKTLAEAENSVNVLIKNGEPTSCWEVE